ncbi:hypothetical protein QAD02_019973 [Eretmocerus hayati]|uniref:Uncharacterized protein n=1 Tax=Eretmocerus hayati TaxID=131215 RepID=A0ACC2PMD3_9HYME|nr:hypothetical protein QAD02_019973 [Eretmocerus hayati]
MCSSEEVLRELPSEINSRLNTRIIGSRIPKPALKVSKKYPAKKEQQEQKCASPSLTEMTFDLIPGLKKASRTIRPPPSLKNLEREVNRILGPENYTLGSVENSSISKMLALAALANGKELEASCHLIASHATCLRQQILYRNLKHKIRHSVLDEPMIQNLDPNDLAIDPSNSKFNPQTLVDTLKTLPTDWNIVHITAEHEHLNDTRHRRQQDEAMYSFKTTHSLHITVLPTGKNAMSPICITLPKPNCDSGYDVRIEIESILNNNKSNLTTVYNNNDLYWKMRKKQNDQMTNAISELESSWLREWRVLFMADFVENLDLVKDVHDMLDKLIADSAVDKVTERTRWLLRKIATGACYLQPFEIERAVTYVLPTQAKLAKNIILSIIAKKKVMDPLKSSKRKTLILILEECLDHISFESMQILGYQPVTRFPSLHIAYALYKQHETTIENGYKIIRKSDLLGTFITNPSLDLPKMEIRIRSFIEYWLPKWEGLYGVKPDLNFFREALTQYHILMYNGHGSGIQFVRGEEIEKLRVLALVLLFGCSSLKLSPVGGRLPAYGVSNQYLIGCSPCILGMLWEVTDGDIDRMTAEFMSRWIPSTAKRPWSDVNLVEWHRGSIEFNKGPHSKVENEQDMLVASAKSKDVCKQYMTSSAIVVRGLPVKLVD